jgi:hypothetical protein
MFFYALSWAGTVPGEVIVRLRQVPQRGLLDQVVQTGVSSIDRLIATRQAAVSSPLTAFHRQFPEMESVVVVRANAEINLDSLVTVLSADPNVEWASPNHTFQSNALDDGYIPNDSLFSEEWWLNKISAPQAWEFLRADTAHSRDSAIVIGIIDTGVDYNHPDLSPNIWRNWAEVNGLPGIDDDANGFVDDSIGWDFVDAPSMPSSGDHLTRDADPMDEFGHGTYVGGIAAAATDNGQCVASVGFNYLRIMCLRAGNAEGFLQETDVAAALLYGAQMHAGVLNMSFGDVVASPLLRETVRLANQAGVVLLASAGNANSSTIHYPSGYPEVISVGATDQLDRRADFSNYGPSVTVMAPGYAIESTIIGGSCGLWSLPNGTSYAVPMVAAVAGLILRENPSLSPEEVKQIIRTTADDLRPAGWDPLTVSGRINARRCVEQAVFGTDVLARITSPHTDDGMSSDFTVHGQAWGADFEHWYLSWGTGENPEQWIPVSSGMERAFGDSLGTVPLPAIDTVIVLRLELYGSSGAISIDHTHLFVQRSAPRIDSLKVRRMLDYDTYGDLVQVWTNQYSGASVILTNAEGDSQRQDFGYVSKDHAGLLSQTEHFGDWQVKVRLENAAGMETLSEPFPFAVHEAPFRSNLWVRTPTSLTHGYIGPFSTDLNGNGRPEIWRLPISAAGLLSNLEVREWNGQDFSQDTVLALYGIYIPQAAGDANQNGLLEFMGRRGDTTRIWEQAEINGPISQTVLNVANFVGLGFLDLDSTDGHGELIGRQYIGSLNNPGSRYVIYGVGASYALTAEDTVPNNSRGDNDLGSPKALIGDLDQDGQLDFLYGDYDGDVIFCERTGADIRQKWSTRLPLNDATSWLASGDLTGDGVPEFVAGCRSNHFGGSESQTRSRHWEYFIFSKVADDSFAVTDSVLILGAEDVGDHPASVNIADVDGDGTGEILISAFPDFYIISKDPGSGRYLPKWYDTPSESNATLVTDWNHNGLNEFFYSDGEHIQRVEAASASGQRPSPPLNLTGEPVSVNSATLIWAHVAEAQRYHILRAQTVPDFEWIGTTTDTVFSVIDIPDTSTYTYAVTSVSSVFPDTVSVLSNYFELTTGSPPSVDLTGTFSSPHFVQIRFSKPMGASALQQWNYRLNDHRQPSVVSPGEGGRVINLAFDGSFGFGQYNLQLSNLRDRNGMRLPQSQSVVTFTVHDTTHHVPHVAAHHLVGGPIVTKIEIAFSEPMSASVLEIANYRIEEPRRVIAVRALDAMRENVEIELDPRYPVGAIGLPARLMLRGLTNQLATALDTTNGQADLLLGGAAATINDAYVFPNPYKGNGAGGQPGVLFAALPAQATIRIFTIQGLQVRKLDHRNSSGATRWDMNNDKGQAVAGGVYLYTIESNGQTVRGKLAILR